MVIRHASKNRKKQVEFVSAKIVSTNQSRQSVLLLVISWWVAEVMLLYCGLGLLGSVCLFTAGGGVGGVRSAWQISLPSTKLMPLKVPMPTGAPVDRQAASLPMFVSANI